MALFSTAYLPSLSYMARFLKEEHPVIEVFDTYHKQTYRNRCRVMTANGVQLLSVPVIKVNGNHTMTADMLISYREPWQQIHCRCLESAYRSAPYFDYCFDLIKPIFENRFEKLVDLNDTALNSILKLLKIQKGIVHTTEYVPTADADFRETFDDKSLPDPKRFPKYYQVFGDRFPFAPDLSILDLLFNEVPGATQLLSKIQ